MTHMPMERFTQAGGDAVQTKGCVPLTYRVHELKADPIPFAAVLSGEKVAEVRVNDRDFQAGDVLILREYDRSRPGPIVPAAQFAATEAVLTARAAGDEAGAVRVLNEAARFTGRTCKRLVTHVQADYGLPDGLVVLSLAMPPRPAAVAEGDAARWQRIFPALDALRNSVNATTRPVDEEADAPLRNALIGLDEDAAFWSSWNRNKQALGVLLDALDAARRATETPDAG